MTETEFVEDPEFMPRQARKPSAVPVEPTDDTPPPPVAPRTSQEKPGFFRGARVRNRTKGA